MIVLLVLGLSVGAIGYVGTDQIAGQVEQRVQDDQRSLAEQQAQSVDSWDERNRLLLNSMADDIGNIYEAAEDEDASNRGRTSDDTQRYFTEVHPNHEGVHEIHHVDVRDEAVLSSTDSELIGTRFDETEEGWAEYFDSDEYEALQFPDQEQPQLVGAHEARDGTTVLTYVRATDNEYDQWAVLMMDLEAYSGELLDDDGTVSYVVERDDENESVVMDSRGESFLSGYDSGVDLAGSTDESEIHQLSDPGSAVSASVDDAYANDDYVVSTQRITGETDWYVVVHTAESEAFGFVATVREYGIYASIGGLVLVVLVGGIVGRNTSRSIDRLTSKAERMEEGDLDVEFETPRVDSIGRLYGGFENMRDSLKAQIQEAQQAREEAEQARAETERINTHLESKAESYSEVMQVCADGDLTERMDSDSENEAMTDIGEEFNEMIAEIEETMGELKAFATEVATASEQVTASSEEVRSASEQVTESIQEISDGAERQNQSLQSVTHEMNGLSTTIEQIAASSNQVADIAERTAETGQRGREAAQDAIEGMNEIESESDEAVAEIERLEAEMEQIDELIEFITEVAEQTNMLALNANIEAARSGDSGEGFSVVAGEVKDLAEETKEAAEDIEERLERIQRQTERTADEVQKTSDRVAEHTDSVERAVDALDEIADYAEETNEGVQEISAASEEQAASTQEVVAMVDDAATISEETTAESENVAAAAEEQTTALTEVSRSASDLATQASQLSEALDRFDTAVDAGAEQLSLLEESDAAADGTLSDLSTDVDGDASGYRADEGSDGTGVAPDDRTAVTEAGPGSESPDEPDDLGLDEPADDTDDAVVVGDPADETDDTGPDSDDVDEGSDDGVVVAGPPDGGDEPDHAPDADAGDVIDDPVPGDEGADTDDETDDDAAEGDDGDETDGPDDIFTFGEDR